MTDDAKKKQLVVLSLIEKTLLHVIEYGTNTGYYKSENSAWRAVFCRFALSELTYHVFTGFLIICT